MENLFGESKVCYIQCNIWKLMWGKSFLYILPDCKYLPAKKKRKGGGGQGAGGKKVLVKVRSEVMY